MNVVFMIILANRSQHVYQGRIPKGSAAEFCFLWCSFTSDFRKLTNFFCSHATVSMMSWKMQKSVVS